MLSDLIKSAHRACACALLSRTAGGGSLDRSMGSRSFQGCRDGVTLSQRGSCRRYRVHRPPAVSRTARATSLSEAARRVIGPYASGDPADVITRLLADLSEHVGSNSVWRTWAGVAAILPWADQHVARLHPAHGQSELRDQSYPITLRPPVNSNRTSPPDDARGRRPFGGHKIGRAHV